MERAILHSDLNAFYASVEQMLNPALRGKAIAVCGSTEDRHGIVLAKSQQAKVAGIKTGMVNWEAKQKCPGLILVEPQYEQYLKYSKLTRAIYQRFSDQVEPYGMDECWIDVTGSTGAYGSPMHIAEEIRRTTREELGLTVSIGVSFSKVIAKLGSDMKKPDAITEITHENFQEKVWPLPVSDLLFVGRATTAKLLNYGIVTIGDLAKTPQPMLHSMFGKNGMGLWLYANGLDTEPVMHKDYHSPVKSIGHGITCIADLVNVEEVWKVMLHLSQDIGHKLRVHELRARGVQITVKNSELSYRQYQAPLLYSTQSPKEIAALARQLFERNYQWSMNVRAVTVRAINLVPNSTPTQLDLFDDAEKRERRYRIEDVVDQIRGRYGKEAIFAASLMGNLKLPGSGTHEIIMPGMNPG